MTWHDLWSVKLVLNKNCETKEMTRFQEVFFTVWNSTPIYITVKKHSSCRHTVIDTVYTYALTSSDSLTNPGVLNWLLQPQHCYDFTKFNDWGMLLWKSSKIPLILLGTISWFNSFTWIFVKTKLKEINTSLTDASTIKLWPFLALNQVYTEVLQDEVTSVVLYVTVQCWLLT